MAAPSFVTKSCIYLYASHHVDSYHQTAYDSLVFTKNEYGSFTFAYAPPWFNPAHVKMDYDLLYLKLLSISNSYVEVEVNQQTGQSAWLQTSDVRVFLWPEFMLNAYAVENPLGEKNPLRVKPMAHASLAVTPEYSMMRPVIVSDEWMKVKLYDSNLEEVGEAWLQWRIGNEIIITYSLLC